MGLGYRPPVWTGSRRYTLSATFAHCCCVAATFGDLVHGITCLCAWGVDVCDAVGCGGGAGAEQWHRGRSAGVQVGGRRRCHGRRPAAERAGRCRGSRPTRRTLALSGRRRWFGGRGIGSPAEMGCRCRRRAVWRTPRPPRSRSRHHGGMDRTRTVVALGRAPGNCSASVAPTGSAVLRTNSRARSTYVYYVRHSCMSSIVDITAQVARTYQDRKHQQS